MPFSLKPGIGFLRGFLESKGIKSDVVDFNKIIHDLENEKMFGELKLYFKKCINKKRHNKDLSVNSYSFFELEYYFISHCPEKIWEAVDRMKFLYPIFERHLKPFLGLEFLAFSLNTRLQLLFSLSLAKWAKEKLNESIKIVMGGSTILDNHQDLITLFKENFIIDYLIMGEGETPLYRLLKKDKLNEVPNLIYHEDGLYKYSKNLNNHEDIRILPTPIYDPGDNPCIQTSRSCYWHKCSFCIARHVKKQKFVVRSPKKVVSDIKTINKRLGNNELRYYFCDEALTKSFITNFSHLILENNFNNKYSTFMRPENWLNKESLELFKRAGFSGLFFGLETTNKRLSKLLNKGIEIKHAINIVKIASKLKYGAVQVCFIIGIPTETKEEILQDFEMIHYFLSEYKNIVIRLYPFRVRITSDFYYYPDKYNISILQDKKAFMSSVVPFKQLNEDAVSTHNSYELFKNFYNKLNTDMQSRLFFDDYIAI